MKRLAIVLCSEVLVAMSVEIVKGWNGIDKLAFIKPRGKNDFSIDDMLGLSDRRVWIGFDVSGGSGNFIVRMAEKGVIMMTSTLTSNGSPISEFVAIRGIFLLEITPG